MLRHLAEPGAVLALADDMERAVILRDTPDGRGQRGAITERSTAEAMALRDWLEPQPSVGRVRRYRISAAGRTALSRLLAEEAGLPPVVTRRAGAAASRPGAGRLRDALTAAGRSLGSESPIALLGRRRDKDGAPFLSEAMLLAASRLREDFELAQLSAAAPLVWDWDSSSFRPAALPQDSRASPAGNRTGILAGSAAAPDSARQRVAAVLTDLGPGLGDVVLRCCCYLEGLESAERHLGWSSRSGKIVLRIGLHRLSQHYSARGGIGAVLIG